MNALRPFFRLLGRASVFWLGAFGFVIASFIVAGLAGDEPRLSPYVDVIFIAVLVFPGLAGLLAGAVVQEFQHTSFAALLPRVRSRVAAGFFAAGLGVTVAVVGWIALNVPAQHDLPMLFAVGLGAYCLGGILVDPLSTWITSFNSVLALFLIVRSSDVARFASDHPWLTAAISLGVGGVCCFRLFARSTFRRKPFRSTSPLPGNFSLEKTLQHERRKRVEVDPGRTGLRTGYLGNDTWRWVRAAIHEVHGATTGWKSALKGLGRLWGIGLLVLAHAWIDKGDMSLAEALARTIHDALFSSPYQPQFGENGTSPIVMLVIAIVGAITALFSSVALGDGMAYPLSRRQRARVLFRGGLVDVALFLFILAPCLFVLGHLTGLLVGFEIRFDFMPYFFRTLMVTLILMPLAQRGRLGLRDATRRKVDNTLVRVIFGVTGFVLTVALGTWLSPRLFVTPGVELAVLVVAMLISQLLYRHNLVNYCRTADLA